MVHAAGEGVGLMPSELRRKFEELLDALVEACTSHWGKRLVSVAVFGSVGRGTPRPDSDVDLLLVVEHLPRGRLARVEQFAPVEQQLTPLLERLRTSGVWTELSPVLKTPEEVLAGSPLFLDMVHDARILWDRDRFLAGYLERLRQRLMQLGARRVPFAGGWYWDLKPDYRPEEVIEF